jgi:hypothetical protein
MISFRNQGPRINTGDIAELEAAVGSKLPPAYGAVMGLSSNRQTLERRF